MAHAILSPSSAARWMACTPSARLEEQFPDTSSEAAAEGTVAHELGELLIAYAVGQITAKEFNREIKDIEARKYYSADMLENCEAYRDFVITKYEEAKKHTPDAELILEARLDLTDFIPDGFGTGDAQIIADGKLEIIDLKYGRGVFVEAEDNPQLMIYGMGALKAAEMFYEIHTVSMTIFQPRINNIKTVEISADRLYAWVANKVQPKAQIAFVGKGDFVTGDHCFFCKAKTTCRAYAEKQLEIAKHEFKQPDLLSQEEIADILSKIDEFIGWGNKVKDYALDEAVNNGVKWDGFKLVEGRSIRRYADQDKVVEKLLANDIPEPLIYKAPEVLGITAMEKAITKKTFNTLLSDLIIKPAGKPTLVPESDKRKAINSMDSAIEDFEE